MTFHADLPAQDIHVIGYVQSGDPGAVGAFKPWVDTSGGSGSFALAVRNAANTAWEYVTGAGAAPDDAQYVVMALNGTLTQERVLAVDSHLTLTDGGAGGNATIGVDLTAGFTWTGNHTFSQDTAFGLLSPAARVHVKDEGVGGTTRLPVLFLEAAITGGVGGAGFGPTIDFRAETTTTEGRPQSRIRSFWVDAADGTRTGGISLSVVYQASLRGLAVINGIQSATYIEGSGYGYGTYDFQSIRTLGTRVPSGDFSCVFGGGEHEVSGDYSGVFAGTFNEVSSNFAVSLGGAYNEVSDTYGATIAGLRAVADKYGQIVSSGGVFSDDGDAQNTIVIPLRRQVEHTDTNWYTLYPDGSGTKQVTINTDTVWTFNVLITGTTQGCVKSFGYELTGVIKNDGGTTTILGTPVKTVLYEDDADFDARVVANDLQDTLEVQVADTVAPTGGDTVRWKAYLRFPEVSYPA